jgi:hypothetical protein
LLLGKHCCCCCCCCLLCFHLPLDHSVERHLRMP